MILKIKIIYNPACDPKLAKVVHIDGDHRSEVINEWIDGIIIAAEYKDGKTEFLPEFNNAQIRVFLGAGNDGDTTKIDYERSKQCPKCLGDGWVYHSKGGQSGDIKECNNCNSTGVIKVVTLDPCNWIPENYKLGDNIIISNDADTFFKENGVNGNSYPTKLMIRYGLKRGDHVAYEGNTLSVRLYNDEWMSPEGRKKLLIDESAYEKLIISGSKPLLVSSRGKDLEPGLIEVPWIMKQGPVYISDENGTRVDYGNMSESEIKEYEESKKVYDAFMDEYDLKHKVCPKCGSTRYSITFMGYMFNRDKPEDYKDLNTCVCECGNECTKHDMISEEEFRS